MNMVQGFVFSLEKIGNLLGVPEGYRIRHLWFDHAYNSVVITVEGPTGYLNDHPIHIWKDPLQEVIGDQLSK